MLTMTLNLNQERWYTEIRKWFSCLRTSKHCLWRLSFDLWSPSCSDRSKSRLYTHLVQVAHRGSSRTSKRKARVAAWRPRPSSRTPVGCPLCRSWSADRGRPGRTPGCGISARPPLCSCTVRSTFLALLRRRPVRMDVSEDIRISASHAQRNLQKRSGP